MLRLIIILIGLLVPSLAISQSYWKHLQQNKLSFGLMFTGGVANGVSDALQHKYSSTVFPQLEGEQLLGFERSFYDPRISWERKYKDWPNDQRAAYPGSKTWLVWSTDAWHFSKTIQLKSMQFAVVTYSPPKQSRKWWWILADAGISSLCFSTGFHLSQQLVIKQ